jgi:hypothetical protein
MWQRANFRSKLRAASRPIESSSGVSLKLTVFALFSQINGECKENVSSRQRKLLWFDSVTARVNIRSRRIEQ